jgi:polyisoprenoid-binding protein YceI
VDAKTGQFFVHAFATGFATVAAHNPKFAVRDFSGEIRFIPGAVSDASVQMRIRATSLEIMDEVSASDRGAIEEIMFHEVLETRTYPEITLESSDITMTKLSEISFRARVSGNLALHGVTQHHQFDAQVVAGEDAIRSYGDFTVKQSSYGLQIASVGGGALKEKDDVRVSFYIIARK